MTKHRPLISTHLIERSRASAFTNDSRDMPDHSASSRWLSGNSSSTWSPLATPERRDSRCRAAQTLVIESVAANSACIVAVSGGIGSMQRRPLAQGVSRCCKGPVAQSPQYLGR